MTRDIRTIRISLSYFGPAREAIGIGREEVEIPEGSSVGDLVEWLRRERSSLALILDSCRLAIGTRYAASDEPIPPSGEVALIPPVAGG